LESHSRVPPSLHPTRVLFAWPHTRIGFKWAYKVKNRCGGSLERYKARHIARGFHHEHGRAYDEAFAHVAHITTVRTLVVASVRHWFVSQLDVKNAILNDELSEVCIQGQPLTKLCMEKPLIIYSIFF
jgi:hypothetical protein